MLIKVILTGHITSQRYHLAFHAGDLVRLITLRGLFVINLCLILVATIYQWYFKVLCIYILRIKGVNRNGKIKGNDVVAKLLFLISVYEFPLLL